VNSADSSASTCTGTRASVSVVDDVEVPWAVCYSSSGLGHRRAGPARLRIRIARSWPSHRVPDQIVARFCHTSQPRQPHRDRGDCAGNSPRLVDPEVTTSAAPFDWMPGAHTDTDRRQPAAETDRNHPGSTTAGAKKRCQTEPSGPTPHTNDAQPEDRNDRKHPARTDIAHRETRSLAATRATIDTDQPHVDGGPNATRLCFLFLLPPSSILPSSGDATDGRQ